MMMTALHDEYAASGGKVVDFHGWALPVQFSGIVQEHLHTRAQAGVFDCSHMGEFMIRGAEAIAAFDRLVFSNLSGLKIGPCRYSAFLNGRGGIIDDCVFFRLSGEELYVITNAGPLDVVRKLIAEACPDAEDLSEATAKIDVQGPASRDVLLAIGMDGIAPMKYWTGRRMDWRGTEIIVSRAGYTGELGYELYVPRTIAVDLWRAVLAHEATLPCGLGARDTLRLETSKPLNGEDLSEAITPLEAGLTPLIQWDKDFIGKDALAAVRDAGDYRILTAILSADRRAPRHGFEVKSDGVHIGEVTSGTFGPSLNRGVGLAFLPEKFATPGTQLTAGPRDLPIETCAMPAYTDGTCRMKFDA